MKNTYTFRMDGDDLVCSEVSGEHVEFKLAEMFGASMEFEDVDFLNQIYETDKISEEMLRSAKSWWEGK